MALTRWKTFFLSLDAILSLTQSYTVDIGQFIFRLIVVDSDE